MRQILLLFLGVSGGIISGFPRTARAQAPDELRLLLPTTSGWNEGQEGETLEFSLTVAGGPDDQYAFQLTSDSLPGMQLDALGNFTWQPNYDVVGPDEKQKRLPPALRCVAPPGKPPRSPPT